MDYELFFIGIVCLLSSYVVYIWFGLNTPMPEDDETDWLHLSNRIRGWFCVLNFIVVGMILIFKSLPATP